MGQGCVDSISLVQFAPRVKGILSDAGRNFTRGSRSKLQFHEVIELVLLNPNFHVDIRIDVVRELLHLCEVERPSLMHCRLRPASECHNNRFESHCNFLPEGLSNTVLASILGPHTAWVDEAAGTESDSDNDIDVEGIGESDGAPA